MAQLLAFALGLIASWVQGKPFEYLDISEKAKGALGFSVAVLACVCAGLLTTSFSSEMKVTTWTWDTLLENIGTAFIASQGFYNLYFKHKND